MKEKKGDAKREMTMNNKIDECLDEMEMECMEESK